MLEKKNPSYNRALPTKDDEINISITEQGKVHVTHSVCLWQQICDNISSDTILFLNDDSWYHIRYIFIKINEKN